MRKLWLRVWNPSLPRNNGPIPDSALKGVYREILNGAFYLARKTRVGYLGPQGTFSHLAASSYFGDSVDYENLRALEGVFEEVARGHVDYGLVPIENRHGRRDHRNARFVFKLLWTIDGP